MSCNVRLVLGFLACLAASMPSSGAEEKYFPDGVFDSETKAASDAIASEYRALLKAMQEPPLLELGERNPAANVYRLLWIPPFHPPVSVRVAKTKTAATLHVTVLSGSGSDTRPGNIAVTKTKTLTDAEWTWILIHLARSKYWKMSAYIRMKFETGIVLDGEPLIVEGVEKGNYHIVKRSDPEKEYEKLCEYLLKLSGCDFQKVWAEYHDVDEAKPEGEGEKASKK